MEDTSHLRPGMTVRRFHSHAEQESETLRYWAGRPTEEKAQAVAEMAESFARIRGIDIDAQGPKRVVARIQRVRS